MALKLHCAFDGGEGAGVQVDTAKAVNVGDAVEVTVDIEVMVLVLVTEHESGQVTGEVCVVEGLTGEVVVVVVAWKRQEHTELASAELVA